MSRLSSARAGVPSAKQPEAKPGGKRGFRGFRKVRGGHWWHPEKGRPDAFSSANELDAHWPSLGYHWYSYWVRP